NALNNAPEGTPFKEGQQVTLTVGTGDNANQAAPRKVAGRDNTTDNRIDFTWEEGDKILVKVGDKTAEFTLSSEPGLNEGEFVGTMPAAGSTFDIQYPVEAPDLSAQVYSTTKTIPADKMLFTATNCTLGVNATLQAQYAMVQLNLFGTDKTVGKIVFTNKTANPAVSYTLTCTGGVAIGTTSAEATPFYMVVPASTYLFEAEIYDNATTPAKICSFATSAAKTFTAGECLNMPAKEVADPYNGHAYVDLGLSVKWATCNVGATTPEGYDDYFAWGETSTKTTYDWSTYFDTNDDGLTFQKYYLDGGKTVLDPEDDAAHVNWGGSWRMPTKAEMDELLDGSKCAKEWTTLNNVNGYKFTSLVSGYENNSIFLPAAGYYNGSSRAGAGSIGFYWSSSLYDDYSGSAYRLYFNSSSVVWGNFYRSYGLPVRPVCK
ncbi:MAG: hypothetical protein KBS42_00140, partial [Bacteroidales bacterium]|nr:hypothetical protein [Candidatus Colicola coprequi]